MNSNYRVTTLRDYLRIVFRHKAVIITVFMITALSTIVGLELKTPVYIAQVKMLITAEKQTASPYYKVLIGGAGRSEIALTQSEIVNSNPVIERAVRVLKLNERPRDYEKNYCSALKTRLIDLRLKMSNINKKEPSEKKSQYYPYTHESDNTQQNKISLTQPEVVNSKQEHDQTYQFRMAVENLKGRVMVEPIMDTNLFTIKVSDFNPVAAAIIANVVSRSYVIFDLEQQMSELQLQYGDKQPIVMQLRDNISKMIQNLSGEPLPDVEAIGPASVKIIEQAQVPLYPTGTSKRIVIFFALFMSLFFGVMLAFVFEYIDHSFKSPQDIELILGLPLIGSIPKRGFKDKRLIKDTKKITDYVQSYYNLSDQIYLLMKDKNIRSVMITASSNLEGSTTVNVNLCNFLSSKAGHKVLIIDANLRTPTIHKFFNVQDSPGLIDVFKGNIALTKAIQSVSSNLDVLPAGKISHNTDIFLNYLYMSDIIKTSREKYELIFIDHANLRSFKEVCILGSYLDGVILVVNEGKTRQHVMKSLLMPLRQKNVNLVGIILKNRTYPIPKIIYERI